MKRLISKPLITTAFALALMGNFGQQMNTAFAGDGGVGGPGGGNVQRGTYETVDQMIKNRFNGVLSGVLRLENLVKSDDGPYRGLALSSALRGSTDDSAQISDALKLMFLSTAQMNPIQAIASGRIKIKTVSGDCFGDGQRKDGSAERARENGHLKLGEGTICLSESRLKTLSGDVETADVFALLVHELGHLYGLDETHALALQDVVRRDASVFIKNGVGYGGSAFRKLIELSAKIDNEVKIARIILNKCREGSANFDSYTSSEIYQRLFTAGQQLQQIDGTWRWAQGWSGDNHLDFFPIPLVTRGYDRLTSALNSSIWFPITRDHLSDYEDTLQKFEAVNSKLKTAIQTYIYDYEIAAYGPGDSGTF